MVCPPALAILVTWARWVSPRGAMRSMTPFIMPHCSVVTATHERHVNLR